MNFLKDVKGKELPLNCVKDLSFNQLPMIGIAFIKDEITFVLNDGHREYFIREKVVFVNL